MRWIFLNDKNTQIIPRVLLYFYPSGFFSAILLCHFKSIFLLCETGLFLSRGACTSILFSFAEDLYMVALLLRTSQKGVQVHSSGLNMPDYTVNGDGHRSFSQTCALSWDGRRWLNKQCYINQCNAVSLK